MINTFVTRAYCKRCARLQSIYTNNLEWTPKDTLIVSVWHAQNGIYLVSWFVLLRNNGMTNNYGSKEEKKISRIDGRARAQAQEGNKRYRMNITAHFEQSSLLSLHSTLADRRRRFLRANCWIRWYIWNWIVFVYTIANDKVHCLMTWNWHKTIWPEVLIDK